jgi:hypothetical protein
MEAVMTRDELTLKAISTYNGNLYNGLTKALEAVVAMALEEAARVAVAPCPVVPHPRECERCSNSKLKYRSPRAAAAAIRALIPEEK